MDSYLRKKFLANLSVDLLWSGDESIPPDKIWGPYYWNEVELYLFYESSPRPTNQLLPIVS